MRYLALLTLIFLLPTAPAGSTTLQRFDLQALTENAERVFHGRCVSTGAEVIDGLPYTAYRFKVDEMVKGKEGEEIIVRLLGGEQNGQRFELVGMPSFRRGEEVVLFLTRPDRRDNAWPVGLSQGKFQVARVGVAKRAVVAQEAGNGQYYSRAHSGAKAVPTDTGPQTLDSFLQRIRGFVDEEPGDGVH